MMWRPNCCKQSKTGSTNISEALSYIIDLYGNKQNTVNQQNQQSTSFAEIPILTVKCHILDRSVVAQDIAISSQFRNPENTKEFICDYFDMANYNFTTLKWNGITFEVLGRTIRASCTIDGRKYKALEGQYFVSILAGLKKL